MGQQYIFFLGSHSELSATEVLRTLGLEGFSPTDVQYQPEYLMVSVDRPIPDSFQDRLGGTDRLAAVIGSFPQLPTADDLGALLFPDAKLPVRRVSLGLSGVGVDTADFWGLGNDLKTWFEEHGGKLRFLVPQSKRSTRLNAAQVMSHKLDRLPNRELTLVATDNTVMVTATIAVQDIRSYARRDTDRPFRDARIGMLPPKLAQIMINLAASEYVTQSGHTPLSSPITLLDPFCGMGTVLQEAWLMDYQAIGTDSSERMIKASEKNLQWLQDHFRMDASLKPRVYEHDATRPQRRELQKAIQLVVTEPFLGKAILGPLPYQQVLKRMNDLGKLYLKVFQHCHTSLVSQGAVLFLLPAYRTREDKNAFTLFPERFLDAIEQIGYSRVQLVPEVLRSQVSATERGTLLYARPDALVGRELTLWIKR